MYPSYRPVFPSYEITEPILFIHEDKTLRIFIGQPG